jgi:hypothetical protein
MPSGKAHALSTVAVAGVSAPALVMLAGLPVTSVLAFAAGCLVRLVITPDTSIGLYRIR